LLTGSWSYAAPPLDLTLSSNIQTTVGAPVATGTGFYRLLEGFGPQTFHGTWLALQAGSTNVAFIYLMSDGNGTITNNGLYNPSTPPGSYSVNFDGGISFILDSSDQTFLFSGQFMPPDDIAFTGSATNTLEGLAPVENVSLCAGSWSGMLTETEDPNGLSDYSVTLTVATNGFVNISSGSNSGTGWIFALTPTNGACCGFFNTSAGAPYDQFRLDGTLTGNTITGSYTTDSSGGTTVSGNFTLTR
jgi:hypothetical protein